MTELEMETFFEMMGEHLRRPDRNGNRSAKCPLAQWTHTKGHDKSPSLTAKADTPKGAVYRCWACQSMGSMFNLAKEFGDRSGNFRPMDYVKSLTKSTSWGKNVEYGARYKRIGKTIQKKSDSELTEEKLKGFMKLVPQYAFERGISKQQILKWEVGFDNSNSRMIFTVRDYLGRLVGVSGRDVTGQQKPKYKHYYGFQKEKVLYGEKFMDRMNTTAYIVEGFLDVLAMERLGLKNVFASMGTSLSDEQMGKLQRFFKRVIMIPDCDDAGAGLQFVQTFGHKLAVKGMKVGIAGVCLNENYILRERPREWDRELDYFVKTITVLKDKDPADLTKPELDEVLKNIQWVDLKAVEMDSIF